MMNGSKKNLLVTLIIASGLLNALGSPVFATAPKSASPAAKRSSTTKPTSPAKMQSALELMQTHTMGGPQRILVSKDGMRLENLNTGVVIISEAPFKEVAWCNPEKKLYYRISANKSVDKIGSLKIVLDTTSEFAEQPWEPPVAATFMGRPALLYAKHTPKKSWCKYLVLKGPKLDDAVLKQICAFSGSMPLLGIPLKWHQFVTNADMFNEVDRDKVPEINKFFQTKSIKEITVPHSVFTRPSDYTETKKRNDVMASSVGFGTYKDLLK